MKVSMLTFLLLAIWNPSPAMAHSSEGGPAAHLSFTQLPLHAHVFWEKGPEVGLESILTIEIRRASDHKAVDPEAELLVEIDMPEMSHGSAPTRVEKIVSPSSRTFSGQYRISQIYFIMNGLWNVHVTLKRADGLTETQTFALTLGEAQSSHQHHHHH